MDLTWRGSLPWLAGFCLPSSKPLPLHLSPMDFCDPILHGAILLFVSFLSGTIYLISPGDLNVQDWLFDLYVLFVFVKL